MMVPTWRIQALRKIMRAYKPKVELKLIEDSLSFSNEAECQEFLTKLGCIIIQADTNIESSSSNVRFLDTKNSVLELSVNPESLLL